MQRVIARSSLCKKLSVRDTGIRFMNALRSWWLVALGGLLALPACAQQNAVVAFPLSMGTVVADVHRPAGAERRAVVLAHGFLRTRATMSGHAEVLAREGFVVVVPDLPSRVDSRENGRALVELVAAMRAGKAGAAIDKVVLVGFSAGGLATLLAADAPGVAGYVGLDAFDRPGGVGLAAARVLRTPAVLLRGPHAFCNAYGIADPWIAALPVLAEDRLLPGGSHCDFEWPTDRWCELVCGSTNAVRQREIRARLVEAVHGFFRSRTSVSEN